MHSAGPAGASRPRSVLFTSRGSAGRRLPARSGAGVAAVPHRATLRKGRDPARPRAGGRGAGAPLRRPSRCGYFCSAPPHCPAQRGARRHSAAAPRAARHRWAGANCRMTGLRQFAPALFGVPATIRGHFRPPPARGRRPFRRAAHFLVHLSAGPAQGKARRGRRPGTSPPGPGPSCHPGGVCSTSGRPASTARQVLRTIDAGPPAVLGADNRASGTCAQRPALLRFWRYRHDDFSPCPSRRSAALCGAPAR